MAAKQAARPDGVPPAKGTYLIRLTRVVRRNEPPVVVYLVGRKPPRWGERTAALAFESYAEARRLAQSLEISGRWAVEEA
jgi:hypothetical protein